VRGFKALGRCDKWGMEIAEVIYSGLKTGYPDKAKTSEVTETS
jgi:hypothetical protein